MGKRAKKAPVVTKRRPTLAKRFKCPFCANEDVVECKMDLSKGVGSLACRMCSASYQMPIHHLHEPVDVFSEWLDDCEAAERGEVPAAAASSAASRTGDLSRVVHDTNRDYDDDDDEDDDDLPEASGLGQKRMAKNSSSSSKGMEGDDDDDDEDGDGGGGTKKNKKKNAVVSNLGLDDSDDDSD
ncbi:hypothetical protein ACHAWU_005761 [Discostella pseudostelligera]|uniref:Transcription elongation factor 1 homolog n=1 Tax=Discostella pseudostelligera TaxID=259834 RepID=A0ABD3N0Q4_9STRA